MFNKGFRTLLLVAMVLGGAILVIALAIRERIQSNSEFLDARITALGKVESEAELFGIVIDSHLDLRLRLAALERITSQEVLGVVAENQIRGGYSKEVLKAAVERVRDKNILNKILVKIICSNNDKLLSTLEKILKKLDEK